MKNDLKALKKLANTKLIEIIIDKDFIKNYNPFQILETIENISKIEDKNILELTKKFLNYFIKGQQKSGNFIVDDITISPIYFLKTITKYLNLKKEKKEVKEYIKYIEKSIEFIEENFDNTYLLLKSTHRKKEEFFALENAILLSISDGISELLNEFDYNSLADRIFLLKGKMELGYSRYFFNKETNKMISSFEPNGNYNLTIPNQEESIIMDYSPNDEKFKESIKIIKEKINLNKNNVIDYLFNLNNIVKFEKELVEKEIKNNFQILKLFPQEILTEKEFNEKEIISKSINKEFKINIEKLKKEKLILFNPNCLNTINLILNL